MANLLWVIFPLAKLVVLVTSLESPRVLDTSRAKLIEQKEAYPCNEGKALAR